MQFFDGPSGFDEGSCQIIKQPRMRRRVTACAEIARRTNQPCAEMVLPDAVYHHSPRKRVVLIDDRLGQFRSPASSDERLAVLSGKDEQKLRFDFLALIFGLSAQKDIAGFRIGYIFQALRAFWRPPVGLRQ